MRFEIYARDENALTKLLATLLLRVECLKIKLGCAAYRKNEDFLAIYQSEVEMGENLPLGSDVE
jgi:hypothetical protein